MSQTIVPAQGAPVSYSGEPLGIVPPPRSRLSAAGLAVRESFAGSPGRLRLIALGAVLSVVVSALVGAWALQMRSSALDRAESSSRHLLLLQNVQTELVKADADATNSFLNDGLEPQEQRLGYIEALAEASDGLARAAEHSREDSIALGEANEALTRYAGYVASARANNRAGNPVGASYMETASALLRADDPEIADEDEPSVLRPIAQRATADEKAVADAFSQAANVRWLLLAAAVIGIGGLVYAQLLVTRHSHRYLNMPAAVSTVGLVLILAAAAFVMSAAQTKASDVRNGSLATSNGLSQSRVAAFNAKASESLTLIDRGSGTDADDDWNDLFDKADDGLNSRFSATAKTALKEYGTVHEQINKLDVAGDWDEAVDLSTAVGDGSANASFQTYADQTDEELQDQGQIATDRLSDAGSQLVPVALLLLLVGLLCAAGAWWGISLRLDEYR